MLNDQPKRPVTRDVLIETDMPELVVAERDGRLWIGVVCEAANGVCRWVYAPISSVEYQAVLAGATEIWESFQKPTVLVVDESADADVVAEIAGESVPIDALPNRGFVLPRWAVSAQTTETSAPQFSLARASSEAAVGLKALAGVSDKIQRLYVALTQRFMDGFAKLAGSVSDSVREAAEIDVVGLVHGSLVIQVKPHDEARFAQASEAIQRLLTAASPADLSKALGDFGGRVQGRYEDLLEEVISHDLALLMSWGGGKHAFVAAHTAGRRIEALPASGPREEDVWAVRGRIVGLDTGEKSFTFFEPRTDEVLRGELADDFNMPSNILIGPDSPIRVIEIGRSKHSTRGGREVTRHQLLRIFADAGETVSPTPVGASKSR